MDIWRQHCRLTVDLWWIVLIADDRMKWMIIMSSFILKCWFAVGWCSQMFTYISYYLDFTLDTKPMMKDLIKKQSSSKCLMGNMWGYFNNDLELWLSPFFVFGFILRIIEWLIYFLTCKYNSYKLKEPQYFPPKMANFDIHRWKALVMSFSTILLLHE
jgi:hypothetical protein